MIWHILNKKQIDLFKKDYNIAKQKQPLVEKLVKLLSPNEYIYIHWEKINLKDTYFCNLQYSDLSDKNMNRLIKDWFLIKEEDANFTKIEWKPSNCHENSFFIAQNSSYNLKIFTWYALSDDWLWREHSCIIDEMGDITETTEYRVAYYGYKLNQEEIEEWGEWYY